MTEAALSVDVEELYRRYGPMVVRRCRGLLRNEEAAVEAMQEVFVQVLRRRDALAIAAPSALLWRMATNHCLNRMRSRRRRPEDPDSEILQRIADAPEPGGEATARLVLDRIFSREQPSTRAMAVAHLVDGLTLEETAELFSMSVSGVRKRLRTLKGHVAELEGVGP